MHYSPDFSSRFRILKGGKISLVVSALIASVTMLHAAPSGGVVTSGSASIAQSGSVTTITQSTNKAAINWQNFSIGKSETVNFNQPNVNAVTLNRVVGNEKSIIDGALNANGQVFILNSNGVLFSKNASINTTGLVATTMNLSDADFMNGNYAFKGDSQASVINQGTINISDAGYAALFGKEVKNEGIIKATLGKVELVGAKEVTLNLNGNSLVNLTVDKGVLDALVENKGAIYAEGGEVYLTTNAVGELLKGVVNNTGIIEANSLEDITGEVILFAHGGALHVNGTIEAEGGFVETSGKSLHVEDSTIIKTKKWLLDPDNVTIDNSAGDIGDATVGATAIQNALSTADIELQATTNITVNENITWSTDKQLTLSADSINVNKTIENTNTANGGVYFKAANVRNKVVFGTDGKVIIHNVNQLQWINTALAGKYELGSDIDASVTSGWNDSKGWEPIITSEEVADGGDMITFYYGFTGTFDGLGHTISNLTINDATRDYVGLFGKTTDATIKNVGLVAVDIKGGNNVGAFSGNNQNTSTIENAYATGSVSGADWVGGLVGLHRDSATIKNSYTRVTVSGTDQVGGLVGNLASNTPIINSYASGTVNGTSNVGGLVGYSGGNGGITNSYYDNQANTGTMGDTGFGKTKANLLALVTGGTWNNTTIWGANGSAVEGYAEVTLPFLLGITKFDNTLFNSGFGTSANPYTITNWTQLQNINYNTATLNKYFTLSNNIDNTTAGYTALASATANSGAGFVPIGGNNPLLFKGTFDGQGHTIADLYINRPTMDLVGLFGCSYGATIRNIGIVNANITGKALTGGLAGNTYVTTITNAYATGSVTGSGMVGGLVGAIDDSTITNSYAMVDVIGSGNQVGGLLGVAYQESLITNSYATGSVQGATSVGGLVGILNGLSSIANSYATGLVTGTTFAGGLLGSFSSAGAVTNSYWDTQTSGKTTSAGGVGAVGKTTEEMKTLSTYTGWNITGTDGAYPTLTLGGVTVWTMSPSTISLSYTLDTQNHTYNGSTYALTDFWSASSIFGASYASWVLGTDYTFIYGGSSTTGFKNAGTYSNITIDILKSGYTEASSGNTAGALTIAQKALTISGLTASNKTYDGTTSVVMTNWGSLSGLVGTETLTLGHGTASFDTATVGNGKTVTAIGYTLSDGDNGGVADNYLLAATTATTTANITAVVPPVTPPTQDLTPIITQIINGTAITPPVIPSFTPTFAPPPPAQAPQQFNAGGTRVQLASVPSGDTPSQLVGTQEARAMIQGEEVGDLRIPLGQNSRIQLVNGGVRLPDGLEQEFFMAQR